MGKYVIAGIVAVILGGGVLMFGLSGLKTAGERLSHALETDHDGHDHEAETVKTAVSSAVDAEEKKHGKEAPVHLTEAQRKLIRIRISKAQPGNIEDTLNLNGEILLNLDETARIMPRMPGFVSRIFVKEGERVRKGQLLATLTSHKLGEYYSNYNSALEQEKLARSEFEMAEKLRTGNATSQKEYLRYKREYAESVISRQRAEELLRSLLQDPAHADHPHEKIRENRQVPICTTYEVTSPLSGTVIAKNVTAGENFTEDNTTVIFTVSNLERLWLELRVPPNDLPRVRTGQAVAVTAADTAKEYSGRIVYVSPLIDEQSRTGFVRVVMENRDGGLRPGQFVTGRIHTVSAAESVVVPRAAVQLIEGESVIFVPQGDGFAPRPVTPGRASGGIVQILAGLKAGEPFVSSGAFELKSILLTSGMDPHAGHGH